MQKNKQSFLTRKSFKVFSTIVMIFALIFSPISIALNPGQSGTIVQKNQAEAAGLADISLISKQALGANYNSNTKELRLNLSGTTVLNLGLVTEQYFTYQLPSEFREVLEMPNFRDAARIEFETGGVLGILLPVKDVITGNNISVDPSHGIVTGVRAAGLSLSVASGMKADLIINLGALGSELPSNNSGLLTFYGTGTKSALVDLPLLTNEGASATLKTIIDTTAPDAPQVNEVTDYSTEVTGLAEPNSTVEVTFPNGETATGTADKAGNFTIAIPKAVELEAGKVVAVTATDKAGNTSEPTTVTIIDTTAPSAPQVNEVTDSAAVVTGTAEAGSTVTVTFPNGETATGITDQNGNFTVAIPRTVDLEVGQEIKVTATDNTGNESDPTTVTIINSPDTTAPDAPQVDRVIDRATEVTGTAEAGSIVTVTFPNGETATGTADDQGKFTVAIPKAVELEAGKVIKVTATDKAGNTSDPTRATVRDTTPPSVPQVNEVTDSATVVTGTAEAGSTVKVTFPNGETATGTADQNGNFTVAIPKAVELKVGQEIKVTATDKTGNESDPTTVIIVESPDTTAPDAPKVNKVTDSATKVTGTAEAGSTVKVTFPNGETATGTADEKGNFTVTVPKGVKLEVGKKVTVTATDAAGNESKPTSVTITASPDTTAPDAPKVNGVTNQDTKVTGSGEPDATVKVTIQNGVYTGKVNKDGSFEVEIPKQATGTKITVTLTDAAGNESKPTTITVSHVFGGITINSIHENDTMITGTADPNTKYVRLIVNGVSVRSGLINPDGTYQISSKYVLDENGNTVKKKIGDVVRVAYYDKEISHIYAERKIGKDPTKIEPIKINPVHKSDLFITGTADPDTKYVSLIVNGQSLRTGIISSDGTYSISSKYVLDEEGKSVSKKVGDLVKVEYHYQEFSTKSAETTVIEDKDDIAPITINTVHESDITVTGKAAPTAKFVRLIVNGQTIRNGAISSDGTYSISSKYVLDENGKSVKKKTGDVVRVEYLDAEFAHVFAETKVKADVVNVAPITINKVYENDLYITGTADPNTKYVNLIVNGQSLRLAEIRPDGSYQISSKYVRDEAGNVVSKKAGDVVVVEYYYKDFSTISNETVVLAKN